MFDFLKTTGKLPRDIKKALKPRKEFNERTKTAFLAVFDATHPGNDRVGARGFTAAAKALIACGALVAILTGVSVYADTANVAADSPLYPLKRLDENVQLAVTPTSEKAQLQATFATRRASELSDLETRKPSSTIIASLSSDLNTELNSSLNDAQTSKLGDGQLMDFCNKIFSALATSSVDVHLHVGSSTPGILAASGLFDSHTNLLGRFVNQCGGSVRVGVSGTTNASGTFSPGSNFFHSASSSHTASTSTISSTTWLHHEKGSGDGAYRLLPGMATTTISVSSTGRLPFLRLSGENPSSTKTLSLPRL